MVLGVEMSAIALLLLLASSANAQNGVFDIKNYNPKADIAEALSAAFKEACASATPSKVVVPAGEYSMGPVDMKGPCKSTVEVQVDGNLKAPAEPKGEPGWVSFEFVDGLTLSGKGVFDGQGHIAWANNNCNKNPNCKSFPLVSSSFVSYKLRTYLIIINIFLYLIIYILKNTDNGVRIKSWPAMKGGEASDIHFEDITMENVTNPVIIDQEYCPWNQCTKDAPSKVKISNVSFKNIKGTTNTPEAVKIICSSALPCEQVQLNGIDLKYTGTQGPAKSECKNAKLTVTGTLNPPGC
ncbi:hypothetical protein Tsubulata_024964 [Turnera subulata]|uniref:Pectate lyase superfamily protein domain-containing protein n=1 Tax=Turnera subulata TaxID=218843 RepID=A0A9Q0JFX5_9ROSI|nr:hypothetical protein Tsubulata_024964 [Turnera subulata]